MTGIAVLSLGSGLLATPPAFAADDRGHGPAGSAWPAPPPKPPLTEQDKALLHAQEQAKASGKPVLVSHLTTATSQTFANPSGSLTVDSASAVERVKGTDGSWKPVDATLRSNPDGSVVPTAVPSALSLSGGGTGPMATMTTADGKKLAVKAPFPLPKPTLNGNSALYRSVLPDIDLELSANKLGGWRQVLIVRTAQAAANPALKKLRLGVEAEGLNVSSDAAGNISVTDHTGRPRFSSPPSTMWDSATEAPSAAAKSAAAATPKSAAASEGQSVQSTRSSPDGPGTDATVADVAVTANAQSIELVPDATLLSRGTGPWYIDPGVNPVADNSTQAWSQVQEAYPTANGFNSTEYGRDQPAAGYCGYKIGNPPCTGIGKTRAYFQIGVNSSLYNAEVINANFHATVVTSSSPDTVTSMGLYSTNAIGSPTSWERQPCDKNSHMGGCTKVGGINMSGTGDIHFNVKDLMATAIRHQWPTVTLGLAPDKEDDKLQRQRFNNTPHIAVEYDITPTVWWPRTSPTPGFAGTGSYAECQTPGTAQPWDNPGWVGANNNITLTTNTYSATGRQLYTGFQIWDDDNNGQSTFPGTGWNGSYGPATVDVGPLTDGHQYGWTARTTDDTLTSTETPWCYFRVDRTPPTASVTSTDFPASGTIGAHPKLVGQEGTFTLTGADPAPPAGGRSSGLACARWTTDPVKAAAGWKCTDTETGVVPLTEGKATIKVTPPRWGTNFVYLQTQDNAGNMSQPYVYSYYAPSDPDAGKAVFGDVNGDHKPDILLPDTAGDLRKIAGGEDPYNAARADMKAAPGSTGNWNNIQISHRGSLGYKVVDDLIAHQPNQPNLYLYTNDNNGGWFDGKAPSTVGKPSQCVTTAAVTIDCAAHGYGGDWSKVTQIAAFGSVTGDSGTNPNNLPRTSLLFVENGRLWLGTAGDTDQLSTRAVLLSADDTRWNDYDLIAPGRAQGTDFPTLWARSKADGTLHAFSVKGTAQAPDLTGFTDPAAGLITGRIDPKSYPRVGSDGDTSGDGIPDLWAVDTNQQLLAFHGTGTAPNGSSAPYPAVTGIDPAGITLGNLNRPTAQWKLTGRNSAGATEDAVSNKNPATPAGISWPTETIGGRETPYAAFSGPGSTITATRPAVDTRKSFTISTWAKVDGSGGVVASQDGTRSSAFFLYADSVAWRFALAQGDTDGLVYDWSVAAVNDAGRFVPGAWTRLTAVYNADTGLMSLYVNGVLASTGHHQAATSPAPSGPLVLGRFKSDGQPDYLGPGLTGGVSNLAVYPYAASVTAPGTSGPIALTASAAHCADNDHSRTEDGNKIQIADCNGTGAQSFRIRDDGSVQVQGKCLNAVNGGTANGTLLELMTCNGGTGQQFLPRADNSLYNPVSGRCVDLDRFNTTTGTQLWLYDCNHSDAQRWTIPTLGTAPLPVPAP
ncbi:ricin-type beta-trefoil lectin domain protein [Streptomyces sp. NBC_01408]|uniref:ricin-type beta-trefoil lectin domain protein n=1 Tax=Streptomyces sp. NBC_01408 TaxID=2903855 RepID=UPI002257EEFA|nr:ricin-type beta-trefoil lectin domain protein [Streptomyces sp. NBC_01408]MCX4696300.1 ricin-type beta-trefoil lectin domain protein [Streptomyces sp. NBC_01408]